MTRKLIPAQSLILLVFSVDANAWTVTGTKCIVPEVDVRAGRKGDIGHVRIRPQLHAVFRPHLLLPPALYQHEQQRGYRDVGIHAPLPTSEVGSRSGSSTKATSTSTMSPTSSSTSTTPVISRCSSSTGRLLPARAICAPGWAPRSGRERFFRT